MTRGTRYSHAWWPIGVAFVAALAVDCAQESPAAPRVLSVRASSPLAAKTVQGPVVSSASPSYGDQGTTIDVQVVGTGFTSGATATWLLNGVVDDHVHTNSTKFVSSTQLTANITIASDASLAFWDVQVGLVGGKNGVGSDAFEVTSAQVLANVNVLAVTGMNQLLEVVGRATNTQPFVIDDASRFVPLSGGQGYALEPNGNTALGRNGNLIATAWTRQSDGTWPATTLPETPNTVESNAVDAAYAPDGSLLVAGWDGTCCAPKGGLTLGINQPVVWRRLGTTWSPPLVYATPAGAKMASALAVNGSGQIAGNVDASGQGAVWDTPTTPTRLDGLPVAINSAGTLLVGRRPSGSTTVPVYWWRDPSTHAWHTTGVPLPTIAGAGCTSGEANGMNDDGVVVGDSCNATGRTQATAWVIDMSSGTPIVSGSARALTGLGARGATNGAVSTAAGVSSTYPYAIIGMAAQSNNQTFPVRWVLF